MVRKQGGVITKFKANENVIERCIKEIQYADPNIMEQFIGKSVGKLF